MEVPTYELQPLAVWPKSVVNGADFTRGHETVFLLYLASHSSRMNETSYLEVPTPLLQAVTGWSKSIGN